MLKKYLFPISTYTSVVGNCYTSIFGFKFKAKDKWAKDKCATISNHALAITKIKSLIYGIFSDKWDENRSMVMMIGVYFGGTLTHLMLEHFNINQLKWFKYVGSVPGLAKGLNDLNMLTFSWSPLLSIC